MITEFDTTLPMSLGLFLCGGGFFISFQNLKSTSLQCQMDTRLIWSCSSRSQEPCKENGTQNGHPELPDGPTASPPQKLLYINMSLAWLFFSITLLWLLSLWPQIGLVYIALKLVSHLQLPLRIWAPKMPNIPQKWRESAKNTLLTTRKSKTLLKNPLLAN